MLRDKYHNLDYSVSLFGFVHQSFWEREFREFSSILNGIRPILSLLLQEPIPDFFCCDKHQT